jgi:hypothetical protein
VPAVSADGCDGRRALSVKSACVKSGGGAGQTETTGRAQISTSARSNLSALFLRGP